MRYLLLLYDYSHREPHVLNPSQQSARERTARSRLQQILRGSSVIRATWVRLRRPCGGAGCKCAKGKRYWHQSWSISQSQKGKLRRKSIPDHLREEVDRWLKDYWEARDLLDQISDEYWSRLEKPRKQG